MPLRVRLEHLVVGDEAAHDVLRGVDPVGAEDQLPVAGQLVELARDLDNVVGRREAGERVGIGSERGGEARARIELAVEYLPRRSEELARPPRGVETDGHRGERLADRVRDVVG